MQAPLRLHDRIVSNDTERRRDPREPRSTTASVVMAGKQPAEALLSDISTYGCCVGTAADWLRPGRCVSIGLAGGLKIDTIVRWKRDGLAGLELLHPVTADQLEWLALID